MPAPTQVIQRPDLGSIAYETMQGAGSAGYIAQQVMPIFETPFQSAEYPIITLEALLSTPDTLRASRGEYNRTDWNFDLGNYATKDHGIEELLDDREAALYRRYFDGEVIAVNRGVGIVLRTYEQRVAAKVQAAANAGSTSAAGAAWSNPATADPKKDVLAGIKAQRNAFGLRPNTVVLGYDKFQDALNADKVKNYLQYTNPHLLETDEANATMLAQYFGVSQVLVGDGQENTAKKGKAATLGNIWDPTIVNLLAVSSGGQDLREPSFGRTFLWTEGAQNMLTVEQYREEAARSGVYRVRNDLDEAIQFVGANHRITGA